jgi:hypothetical protein
MLQVAQQDGGCLRLILLLMRAGPSRLRLLPLRERM